jgi:hypothetical protein
MTHCLAEQQLPSTQKHRERDPRSRLTRRILKRKGLPDAQLQNLYAGFGTSCGCDACGKLIAKDEVEYELDFRQGEATVTISMHLKCWESSRLD